MLPKLIRLTYVYHKTEYLCPLGTHSHHEYVYCLRGQGRIEVEGTEHDFTAGTIYITAAHSPHMERSGSETEIIFFHFDYPPGQFATGVFHDTDNSLLTLLRQLQHEEHTNEVRSEEMRTALLTQLLISTERSRINRPQREDIAPVLDYIDRNFQSEIDIRTLAKEQGYSYDRFRHWFRECVGTSPWNYVTEKRIGMAKHLIKTTNLSLTEIAYECGFSSSSLFSTIFRTKIGVSPTEYKKQYTGHRSHR